MPKAVCPPPSEGGSGSKFLLPCGEYDFALTNFLFKRTKADDADMLQLEFENGDGVKLWSNITFKPQCVWVAFAFLRAFGIDKHEGDEVDFNDALISPLIGHTCKVKTGQENDNNGNKRNKLVAYIASQQKLGAKPEPDLGIDESRIPF